MLSWNRDGSNSSNNARPVASNIQAYVNGATLPPILYSIDAPKRPPEGHKSHKNSLAIRPEQYRKLRRMDRVDAEVINNQVLAFIRLHIPSGSINVPDCDPETGTRPSLPAKGFDVQDALKYPVRHIEVLGVSWIDQFLLQTIERVFQLVPGFEAMRDWSFNRPDTHTDIDNEIFRYFVMEREKNNGVPIPADGARRCDMVIAYQPEWILSPQDLLQVTHTHDLPVFDAKVGLLRSNYNGAQRVWGKLWDICRSRKCRSFVLTNYSNWVFGGFSEGWTFSCVTTIRNFNDVKPSILETMLYWINCSIRPNEEFITTRMPEIISNSDDEDMDIQLTDQTPLARVEYARSESQWETSTIASDLRSDYSTSSLVEDRHELLRLSPEPADSDDLGELWDPPLPEPEPKIVMVRGRMVAIPPPPRNTAKREAVRNWEGRHVRRRTSEDPKFERESSPALSDWSDAATVRGEDENEDSDGSPPTPKARTSGFCRPTRNQVIVRDFHFA